MDQPTEQPVAQSETTTKEVVVKSSKSWVVPTLLCLLLLAGIGFIGWKYMTLKSDNDKLTERVTSLAKMLEDTKKTSSTPNASTSTSQTATSTPVSTKVTLTTAQKANIVDSLNTMNTQPLESMMANSVSVVIAASEFQGLKTPSEAVASLNYLSTATHPWDFNLSAATITSYSSHFYAQYFGADTYVGKAVSKQVVSFHTNAAGKIDVIFMATDDGLLTE